MLHPPLHRDASVAVKPTRSSLRDFVKESFDVEAFPVVLTTDGADGAAAGAAGGCGENHVEIATATAVTDAASSVEEAILVGLLLFSLCKHLSVPFKLISLFHSSIGGCSRSHRFIGGPFRPK